MGQEVMPIKKVEKIRESHALSTKKCKMVTTAIEERSD